MASNHPSAQMNVSSYDELIHHEIDELNLMDLEFALPPSGRIWYGESFRTNRNRSFTFDFNNRIETEPINIYSNLATRSFTQGSISYFMNGILQHTMPTPNTTVDLYNLSLIHI